jgi:hypothetical protein
MRPVCGYCFFIKECDILPRVLKPIEISGGGYENDTGRRLDCFPGSEKPRPLVPGRRPRIRLPLVSDPLQGRGLWRHKPDQTAARNTDNSNRVIVNPETCDRGRYTHFCGYFLHVSDPGAQDPIVRQFSPTGNGGWNRVSRGGSEELVRRVKDARYPTGCLRCGAMTRL